MPHTTVANCGKIRQATPPAMSGATDLLLLRSRLGWGSNMSASRWTVMTLEEVTGFVTRRIRPRSSAPTRGARLFAHCAPPQAVWTFPLAA